MNILEKNIKLPEFFFFLAYAIYLGINIVSFSFLFDYTGNAIYKYGTIFSIILLLVKEFLCNEKLFKKTFTSLVLVGLIVVMMYATGTTIRIKSIPLIFLFPFCSRDVDLKKISLFTIIETGFLLLMIILMSQTGIIKDYIMDIGTRNRHFLGFLYALYPSTLLFNITILSFYLSKDHFNFPYWIILVGCNYWVYKMTDSRLTFVLCIFTLLCMLIYHLFPRIFSMKILNIGMVFAFIIGTAISFYCIYAYDPGVAWTVKLDSLLTTRLSSTNIAIDTYGIHLFGQKVELVGHAIDINGMETFGTYNYVDCLYMQFLLRYGYILFIPFLCFLTFSQYKSYIKKDHVVLFLGALAAAQFMIDDLSFCLFFSSIWFLLMHAITDPVADTD
ncbi:MAG: hypothetical protein IKR11_08245 [Solobacterium sp.]|nr:hypothetical protein [Solobacterium sp.]